MGIIIRQSIKATIINYFGAFIGFITTIFVLTRFLKPDEIGLTKVLFEIAALVAGFAQLGTSASAMRFFPYFKDPEQNHNDFFFYLMLMPTLGCLVFISLFLLLKEPIIDFFREKSALLVEYYDWIIPLIVFITFWYVLETYSNALMRIVIPKFIREIGIRVMLLALYLIYAFDFINLTQLVTGFVLVYGVVMLSSLLYISSITSVSLKFNLSFWDKALFTKVMKYTLFLVIGAIGGNIMGQLDVFMVSSQLGLNYAGIYTVATYMALVIEMPSRSISAISSPIAAAALKEGDLVKANQLYKRVSLHQLLSGSLLFLLIWINIDNIFAIIPNGEIYATGKWVVFFIAMTRLIANTLAFGGTLISFSKYYYWGLYFTFFLSVLTISTNYLFIPLWGMNGAAVATLLTCVVSYSLQQWIVLRKVKGNPYSIGFVKQILLILFLWGCNAILPHWTQNPYLDSVYRTFIIGACWLYLTYKLRISEELNKILEDVLQRLKG